ncbi:MAG: hypothetical protein JSU85_09905 [Candidatus Zixiibacteriota bacterium]|nr:MAG: hypothetical protein JSU85_09905 [candidate division Zixibacteria bacterium]
MKKTVLILVLISGLALAGCDSRSALDKIIQEDPEYRAYIMGELLSYEDIRAVLADTVFADEELFSSRIDSMCQVDRSRETLLQHILAADTTGEWIVGKLAENPDIKQVMRRVSRR